MFLLSTDLHFFIKVEPYWNVKFDFTIDDYDQFFIKVEPYWNVKRFTWRFVGKGRSIKVEPYWNVKVNCTSDNVSSFLLK